MSGKLNKTEIQLLNHLQQNNYNSQMNSQTIRSLSQSTGLNYFRLRSMINHLSQFDLICPGYKEGNANTYFVSPKGIETLKAIKKEDDIHHLPEEQS